MSPAYYFIWDGVRAIDYVLTRPEVDANRIGVTGRSGGGTLTTYLAAFDPRVKAAAPECYITSYENLLLTLGPQDAEQNFAKSISRGLDIADLLVMFSPKPLRIISTTRDIFSIQGARDAYAEVLGAYSAFGKESYFSMVEDDAVHESTRKNRESAYQFFQEYLDNPGSPKDEDLPVFDEKELYVTTQGNVFHALGGHDLHALAKAHLETLRAQKKPITDLKDLRRRIRLLNGSELGDGEDEAIFPEDINGRIMQ